MSRAAVPFVPAAATANAAGLKYLASFWSRGRPVSRKGLPTMLGRSFATPLRLVSPPEVTVNGLPLAYRAIAFACHPLSTLLPTKPHFPRPAPAIGRTG